MVSALFGSWGYIGKDNKNWNRSLGSTIDIRRFCQFPSTESPKLNTTGWPWVINCYGNVHYSFIHSFIHSFELLSGIWLSEMWKSTKLPDSIADGAVEIWTWYLSNIKLTAIFSKNWYGYGSMRFGKILFQHIIEGTKENKEILKVASEPRFESGNSQIRRH